MKNANIFRIMQRRKVNATMKQELSTIHFNTNEKPKLRGCEHNNEKKNKTKKNLMQPNFDLQYESIKKNN